MDTKNQDQKKTRGKIRGKISYFFRYLKSFSPLLLRHHPTCKRFQGHCFKIGKKEFCMGCFLGYPTAIAGIFVLSFFVQVRQNFHAHFLLFAVILLSSFMLSPLKLTDSKPVKMIQKLLIGIGASLLFWWIWELPYSYVLNFTIFSLIFIPLLMLFNIYHFYSLYKTCRNCNYALNWDKCPGFKIVKENLVENGMGDVLEPFNDLPEKFQNN
ncbi:MAG: hypothetical protein ACOC35_10430 [Promethearchaeia archaeon]